jgi:hypothetical protein
MKHISPRCWLWIVIIVALASAWWMDRQKLEAAIRETSHAAPIAK